MNLIIHTSTAPPRLRLSIGSDGKKGQIAKSLAMYRLNSDSIHSFHHHRLTIMESVCVFVC